MDHEGIENAWFYQTIPESTLSEPLEIEEGSCISPRSWPSMAIECGYVSTAEEYYSRLYDSAFQAAQKCASDLTQTPDR